MESISCHITILVINSLEADIHTHKHMVTKMYNSIYTDFANKRNFEKPSVPAFD